jgi:hypothetical protein
MGELQLKHLAQAERHVAEGLEHIRQQQEIVAGLERDGHDATQARALLKTFLETQASHEEGLARIRAELDGP